MNPYILLFLFLFLSNTSFSKRSITIEEALRYVDEKALTIQEAKLEVLVSQYINDAELSEKNFNLNLYSNFGYKMQLFDEREFYTGLTLRANYGIFNPQSIHPEKGLSEGTTLFRKAKSNIITNIKKRDIIATFNRMLILYDMSEFYYSVLRLIKRIKKQLAREKRYDLTNVDIIEMINIFEGRIILTISSIKKELIHRNKILVRNMSYHDEESIHIIEPEIKVLTEKLVKSLIKEKEEQKAPSKAQRLLLDAIEKYDAELNYRKLRYLPELDSYLTATKEGSVTEIASLENTTVNAGLQLSYNFFDGGRRNALVNVLKTKKKIASLFLQANINNRKRRIRENKIHLDETIEALIKDNTILKEKEKLLKIKYPRAGAHLDSWQSYISRLGDYMTSFLEEKKGKYRALESLLTYLYVELEIENIPGFTVKKTSQKMLDNVSLKTLKTTEESNTETDTDTDTDTETNQ